MCGRYCNCWWDSPHVLEYITNIVCDPELLRNCRHCWCLRLASTRHADGSDCEKNYWGLYAHSRCRLWFILRNTAIFIRTNETRLLSDIWKFLYGFTIQKRRMGEMNMSLYMNPIGNTFELQGIHDSRTRNETYCCQTSECGYVIHDSEKYEFCNEWNETDSIHDFDRKHVSFRILKENLYEMNLGVD